MSQASIALLNAIVTATPEIAAFASTTGEVRWVNPAFVTLWPCADKPTVEGLLDVVHPEDQSVIEAAWEAVASDTVHNAVRLVRLGCGHVGQGYREGRVRLSRVDANDAPGSVVIHVETLDGSRPAAGRDPLTGLVDRFGLMTRLETAIAARRCAALVLVDLDRFHAVNQTLGYAGGDQVLITVGRRLAAAASATDVVARVGSDEFAVLCCDPDVDVEALVADLQAAIRQPVLIGGAQCVTDGSIGITMFEVMSDTHEAMALAESAVRLAKSRGSGGVEVFDRGLRDSAIKNLQRTAELRDAVKRGEIVLRYQPIVDLATGGTVGCEALLRWQHPTEGELVAGEFIDIAEASGLVGDLTSVLLTDGCLAAAALGRRGEREQPYVSVNLSPSQLVDPQLVDLVERALRRSGIDPSRLMLEITERAVLTDMETAVATLAALRERGVRIALDDFGTGFSSLLRLRELPVDCLKIDRAFVNGITHRDDDLAIVASVVNMAATLSLACIAEGVETRDQVEQLRRLGCEAGQGYLWSPAIAVTEVNPTYGTAPVRQRPLPDSPADATTSAWIMRLHRAGSSLNTIAAALNQAGARTRRGTRWHPRTVAAVVSQTAYPQLHR